MRVLNIIPLTVCLTLLAGCEAMEEIEQINRDSDRATCSGYGFTEGTDAFATCMMRLDRERERSLSQDNDPPRRPHGDRDNGGMIDPRPQFDKNGNPNFDTEGNWIGCHGIGCMVDNPDA
ncbi:hypothetical protein [Paracoccus laeviglucosivorans]|uniref:Lipoprotein n=1 Tax=Paracoccus laeviglucosivorans TaxID=1197861 RepID=A0A521APH5_9RHOB|nr:hypothetical protein [Paracoccus laeviglucosivorans]SMO36733.1 hypothetical protein SAMN06265221_101249 [Paracoccus laeviglucosivorans]